MRYLFSIESQYMYVHIVHNILISIIIYCARDEENIIKNISVQIDWWTKYTPTKAKESEIAKEAPFNEPTTCIYKKENLKKGE